VVVDATGAGDAVVVGVSVGDVGAVGVGVVCVGVVGVVGTGGEVGEIEGVVALVRVSPLLLFLPLPTVEGALVDLKVGALVLLELGAVVVEFDALLLLLSALLWILRPPIRSVDDTGYQRPSSSLFVKRLD
jgi:hypothetical protein